jgi:hypothetical protein
MAQASLPDDSRGSPGAPVISQDRKKTPSLSGTSNGDVSYEGYTSLTFGLSISVDGRPAGGHLLVVEGTEEINSVKLSSGIAIFTLPKDLERGVHSLDLVFEPSQASQDTVEPGTWRYTIRVKKPSEKKAETLSSRYCRAVQRLSRAQVEAVQGGVEAAQTTYRAYTKVIAAERDAKAERYWKFLRDSGPGLELRKVASSQSVYVKYRDFKPSTAQRYESKAQTRCVG